MAAPTFNILSLCAGAGGLDLGIHLACGNARTVGYVEIEAYACAVLASRMADEALDAAPIWTNLRTFDGRPWRGIVDCIVGGYPCQPFSAAGARKGTADPRHLWPDIARIIREIEPRRCFFENVGGHLSLGFDEVGSDLQQMGYRVAAGIFSAEEADASHRRERMFIMADRADLGHERTGGARGRRSGPSDGGSDMADCQSGDGRLHAGWGREGFGAPVVGRAGEAMAHPDGEHPGAERQQPSGQQRLLAQGDGPRAVDDALRGRHGDPDEAIQAGRGSAFDAGQSGVGQADACGARLSQRQEPTDGRGALRNEGQTVATDGGELANAAHRRQRREGHPDEQPARTDRRLSDFPLTSPGPGDPRWPAILASAPELIPADSRYSRWAREVRNAGYAPHGDPAEGVPAGVDETEIERALRPTILSRLAQSLLRRKPHGVAERVDQLRLCGNGVYPLAAAIAWASLSATLAARTRTGELPVTRTAEPAVRAA